MYPRLPEAEPHVARSSLTRSEFEAILVVFFISPLLLLLVPFVFLRSHSPLCCKLLQTAFDALSFHRPYHDYCSIALNYSVLLLLRSVSRSLRHSRLSARRCLSHSPQSRDQNQQFDSTTTQRYTIYLSIYVFIYKQSTTSLLYMIPRCGLPVIVATGCCVYLGQTGLAS